jgi:hypothetical protein
VPGLLRGRGRGREKAQSGDPRGVQVTAGELPGHPGFS